MRRLPPGPCLSGAHARSREVKPKDSESDGWKDRPAQSPTGGSMLGLEACGKLLDNYDMSYAAPATMANIPRNAVPRMQSEVHRTIV